MLVAVFLAIAISVDAVPASTFSYVRPMNKPMTFAPLHKANDPIPNSYIVTFKDDVSSRTMQEHTSFIDSLRIDITGFQKDQTAGIQNVFMTALKGYHGHFDEETVDVIRASPHVAAVEQDQRVWTSVVQDNAPWGLARISREERLPEAGPYRYLYDKSGGEGVDVYVIDTGINTNHGTFEGRASWGHNVLESDQDNVDHNGHGTHCAGIVASSKFGVAKKANVIAVKVLGKDGGGSTTDVLRGVDWVAKVSARKAEQARAEYVRTGRAPAHKGSVASMSLGGSKSPVLRDAISYVAGNALPIVAAAGNDNYDACFYSPGDAENAITVGATDLQDRRSIFSNWGSCVNVFAPGTAIESTWNTGPYSTEILQGTSMAAPHVAGVLALILSLYPYEEMAFVTEHHPTLLTSLATTTTGSLVMRVFSYFVPSLATYKPIRPIPRPVSPIDLKKALLKLSFSDILEKDGLGEGSPNLLVFNNYTSTKLSSKEFWAAL